MCIASRSARTLVVLMFLAALLPVWASEKKPLDTSPQSTEARILADLRYLAGDECEGRGIFTRGILKAADYIAAEFKRLGLKPGGVDGTYFQPFEVVGQVAFGKNNTLKLVSKDGQVLELERGKDFNPLSLGSGGKVAADVVFLGYGLSSDDPAYDDYAGVDVAGKVVIVFRSLPRDNVPYKPNFAEKPAVFAALSTKAKKAQEKKAAAIIFVNTSGLAANTDSPLRQSTRFSNNERVNIPTLAIKRAVLAKVLQAAGKDLDKVEKAIEHDFAPQSFVLEGWRCELETDLQRDSVQCKNIIGVVEGSGPLADEILVIGAHYDHLGYGGMGSLAPGSFDIHYGADDNGSGTVAVLELARRFAEKPDRTGRKLVFMLYSAEETGLLGSTHYCNNPLFPLQKTVAMYNLDMVGRYRKDVKLQINGTTTAKNDYFKKIVTAANEKHQLEISMPASSQFFGASDHFSFYRKDIPVLFLFTGMHPQYHRPTDRVETINIEGIRQCVELSETILQELATNPQKPIFVRAASPTAANPNRGGPRLGIMPNYNDDKEGVLLDDVTPGGLAARGGLKKGDRIIALNGKPVQNIQAYMTIMSGFRRGDKLEITLSRDGQTVTVTITLE